MKKFDICVFGGCSVDRTFNEQSNNTYLNEPNYLFFGGKGANQAIAAARAGSNVVMLSKVGNDEVGKQIIQNLKNNNVDTENIEIAKDTSSDYSDIYVSLDGDNDIHRHNGAIESFNKELVLKYADVIKNSKLVIAQLKAPKEFSIALINFCYDNNVPVVITPCRPDRLKISEKENLDLINKITYITANEKEYKTIFDNMPIEDGLKMYPNKLFVTLGPKGVAYHNGNNVEVVSTFIEEKRVDTTGAGDTFNGNLFTRILKGDGLETAIDYASAASTLQIQKLGAQDGMPTTTQVTNFLKSAQKYTYVAKPENELKKF